MAANAHHQLVQTAVDGGMNTLRVWCGVALFRVWLHMPLQLSNPTSRVCTGVEGCFYQTRGTMLAMSWESWYDACEESAERQTLLPASGRENDIDCLLLQVYHDMQYAQGGHSPKNDDVQDAELRHQIRRLSSHASIVLWDGCNECRVLMGTNTGIYATFVRTFRSLQQPPAWTPQTNASTAPWSCLRLAPSCVGPSR